MAYPAAKTTFPVRVLENLIPASDYNGQNDLSDQIQEAFGYGSTFMHISASINPSVTATYDLGTNLLRWDMAYIDDRINCDVYNNIESDLELQVNTVTKIKILETGEVGINQATPVTQLDVVGNMRLSGFLDIGASQEGQILAGGFGMGIAVGVSKRIDITNGGTTNLSMDESKIIVPSGQGLKVGINVDAPVEVFEVEGNMKSNGNGDGLILRTPDDTKNYKITVDNSGTIISTLV